MILKSVGVFSAAKVMGCLYALMGLIIGGLFSLIALAGMGAGGRNGPEALFFGAGAVIAIPIGYGILGFIGGIISAVLYNIVASVAGGLEFEFEMTNEADVGDELE